MHETMDSMQRWAPIVKAMSLATADQIYAEKYATACRFNDLNPGKDVEVLDTGVNSGPSRSIKIAQKVVGFTGNDVDGVLGPKTLAAINAYDPVGFINDFSAARLRFLQGLSIWPIFGRGWTGRVNDLQSYARGLLRAGSPIPAKPQKRLQRIPMAFAKGWE
jgi:lysozyme family protein